MTINDFFASIDSDNELFAAANTLRSENSVTAIMDGTDGLANWDPWN